MEDKEIILTTKKNKKMLEEQGYKVLNIKEMVEQNKQLQAKLDKVVEYCEGIKNIEEIEQKTMATYYGKRIVTEILQIAKGEFGVKKDIHQHMIFHMNDSRTTAWLFPLGGKESAFTIIP